MGVDLVDVRLSLTACATNPVDLGAKLIAKQDMPLLDERHSLSFLDLAVLVDAATDFTAFTDAMEDVAPAWWIKIPETPANPGRTATYELFRAFRLAC